MTRLHRLKVARVTTSFAFVAAFIGCLVADKGAVAVALCVLHFFALLVFFAKEAAEEKRLWS